MPLKASLEFLLVELLPQHGLEPAWTQSLELRTCRCRDAGLRRWPSEFRKAGRERIMDCFNDNCLTPFDYRATSEWPKFTGQCCEWGARGPRFGAIFFFVRNCLTLASDGLLGQSGRRSWWPLHSGLRSATRESSARRRRPLSPEPESGQRLAGYADKPGAIARTLSKSPRENLTH